MSKNEDGTKKKMHYGYLIAVSCGVILFGPVAIGLNCAGIFFTPVSQSLGIGPGAASYFITGLSGGMIVFLPFAGKLFAKYSVRVLSSLFIAIECAALFAVSFVTQLWQYILCGFIIGLCLATLLHLLTSGLINRWFIKKAGTMIGICFACTGLGGVVWNPVIGSLIANYGWQTAYRLEALIALVIALPFSAFVIRSYPSEKGLKPYGYSEADEAEQGGKETGTGVSASRAFKSLSFVFLGIYGFIAGIGMYGYSMTASFVSSLPIALSIPLLGATVSSIAMLGQLIGKVTLGYIGGEKNVLLSIYISLGLGILGVCGYLLLHDSVATIYISGFCLGFFAVQTNVLMAILTRKLYGTRDYVRIYSIVAIFGQIGGVCQAPILGTIRDATGSFYPMYTVLLCLFVFACFMAPLALKTGKKLQKEFTA